MDECTIPGRHAFADTSELCVRILIVEDRMHRLADMRDGLRAVSADLLSVLEDDVSEPLTDAADIIDWTCRSMIAERDGMIRELAGRRGFRPDVPGEEVSLAGGLAGWMVDADTAALRRVLAGYLGIL